LSSAAVRPPTTGPPAVPPLRPRFFALGRRPTGTTRRPPSACAPILSQLRASGSPLAHVGSGYCELARHKTVRRARAWAVATAREQARHATVGVSAGLARPVVERATPGPGWAARMPIYRFTAAVATAHSWQPRLLAVVWTACRLRLFAPVVCCHSCHNCCCSCRLVLCHLLLLSVTVASVADESTATGCGGHYRLWRPQMQCGEM
jgi:hypothetical protein